MNNTWPPPQVIFVGFEPNQHGHAALQEHASSSCPVFFHGTLVSSAAPVLSKIEIANSREHNRPKQRHGFYNSESLVPSLTPTSSICAASQDRNPLSMPAQLHHVDLVTPEGASHVAFLVAQNSGEN